MFITIMNKESQIKNDDKKSIVEYIKEYAFAIPILYVIGFLAHRKFLWGVGVASYTFNLADIVSIGVHLVIFVLLAIYIPVIVIDNFRQKTGKKYKNYITGIVLVLIWDFSMTMIYFAFLSPSDSYSLNSEAENNIYTLDFLKTSLFTSGISFLVSMGYIHIKYKSDKNPVLAFVYLIIYTRIFLPFFCGDIFPKVDYSFGGGHSYCKKITTQYNEDFSVVVLYENSEYIYFLEDTVTNAFSKKLVISETLSKDCFY